MQKKFNHLPARDQRTIRMAMITRRYKGRPATYQFPTVSGLRTHFSWNSKLEIRFQETVI